MNPEISVIIPVYRSMPRLRDCLDAVLAQTYQNFELLLIDDASPDESPGVCDEYAARDSRIKVFHLSENCGIAGARNYGLGHATGTYIQFFDADDDMLPKMLEETVFEIKKHNVDIVVTPVRFTDVSTNMTFHEHYDPGHWEISDRKEMWTHVRTVLNTIWNKLYKREIIEKFQIRFDPEIVTADDTAFNCIYFQYISGLSIINKYYYHWYMNWSSTQGSRKKQNYSSFLALYKSYYQLYEKYDAFSPDDKRIFSNYFYFSLSWLFGTNKNGTFLLAKDAVLLKKEYTHMVLFPKMKGGVKFYLMSILVWFGSPSLLGVVLWLKSKLGR